MNKNWKYVLKHKEYRCSTKSKDPYTNGAVQFRIDSVYDENYNMKDLIKVMNNQEHILKWDP